MHLCTVVKISAETAAEAIDRVNDLLSNFGAYDIEPFDYVDENQTKVSDEVKTEEDFQKLVKTEERRSAEFEKQANENQGSKRGYFLELAGESLQSDNFWSTERLAYDYDFNEINTPEDRENLKVFYIETDRHY